MIISRAQGRDACMGKVNEPFQGGHDTHPGGYRGWTEEGRLSLVAPLEGRRWKAGDLFPA